MYSSNFRNRVMEKGEGLSYSRTLTIYIWKLVSAVSIKKLFYPSSHFWSTPRGNVVISLVNVGLSCGANRWKQGVRPACCTPPTFRKRVTMRIPPPLPHVFPFKGGREREEVLASLRLKVRLVNDIHRRKLCFPSTLKFYIE